MSADLLKVSKGLKLVFYGLLIVVIAIVLGIIGVFAAGFIGAAAVRPGGAVGAARPGTAMLVVLIGVGVLGFAGNIVGLVGRFFCLATPPEAQGAKARITLSVIFEVCALLNSLVLNVDNVTNMLPPVVKMVAGGFGMLMQIAAVILFLLFTKALAEFIRRRQLADDAQAVLFLVYGVLGCYAVSLAVSLGSLALGGGFGGPGAGGPGAGFAVGACLGGILSLVALVIALIAVVKYARLLTELSDAVRSFAKKVRRQRRDEDEDDEDEEEEDYSLRSRRSRRDDEDEGDAEDEDDLDEDRGPRRRRPRDD